MEQYILVIDIGSTNVKASLIDKSSQIFCSSSSEFPVLYPEEGMVEESATVVWGTTVEMIRKVMTKSGISEDQIHSIGITNQRETFLIWDKETGMPVYNAVGWQDKRGMPHSLKLQEEGYGESVYKKTGLPIGGFMATGTKAAWVLDHVPGIRGDAEQGKLLFGTFDTWIIWNLTKGKCHVTDVSNASRTLYLNINTLKWDRELLGLFGIPEIMMPEVRDSGGLLGYASGIFHKEIPIMSAIGDAHAATLGQRCVDMGMVKATYGTTCVMMANMGDKPAFFPGLNTTVGWKLGKQVVYLYEAGFYSAGLSLKWLRDVMQVASDYQTMNRIAEATQRTPGLYMCPTFLGLATPSFCESAKGLMCGLTVTSGPNDIIKATMDSIAYSTEDCILCLEQGLGAMPICLAVDGGVTNSDYIMQLTADMTRIHVVRKANVEATTLGAAYAAGLAGGYWVDMTDIESRLGDEQTVFIPSMDLAEAKTLYGGWKKVVDTVLNLAEE